MSTKFTTDYIRKAMLAAHLLGEPAGTEMIEALMEIVHLQNKLAEVCRTTGFPIVSPDPGPEIDSRYWVADYGRTEGEVTTEEKGEARVTFHDFGWEEGVQRYKALVDLETGGLLRVQLLTPAPAPEEDDSPG